MSKNNRSGYSGNETVASKDVSYSGGVASVDIVGCFEKDTPEDKFEFYDLFVDGECINLGEPLYEYPSNDDIRDFLELREELMGETQRRDEKNGLYPEKWDDAN